MQKTKAKTSSANDLVSIVASTQQEVLDAQENILYLFDVY